VFPSGLFGSTSRLASSHARSCASAGALRRAAQRQARFAGKLLRVAFGVVEPADQRDRFVRPRVSAARRLDEAPSRCGDPQAWLAAVLRRIAGHPVSRLEELLPDNRQPQA